MPIAPLELSYEPPAHGWIKLRLTIFDQEIEIDASDVPNDPVQQSVVAVRAMSEGRDASVWWHLEPEWYVMRFKHTLGGIRLDIERCQSPDETSKQSIFACSGVDVMAPFLGFLRDFRSRNFSEDDWPKVDWRPLDQPHVLFSM
jgi:hypothetical protein